MRDLKKIMAPLARRVAALVNQCVVAASRYDGGVLWLTLKTRHGDVDDVPLLLPAGLSYRPRAGAEACALALGGDRSSMIGVAAGDDSYLLQVSEGEVALAIAEGPRVHLRTNGDVDIVGTRINLTGQLFINGVPYLLHAHAGVTPGSGASGAVAV